jgi:hypothetical protein
MNFSTLAEPNNASCAPTTSRQCDFGLVEVLRCGDGVWRWRCVALHATTWSKATFTTMMDAYQGAAGAAYDASSCRRVWSAMA